MFGEGREGGEEIFHPRGLIYKNNNGSFQKYPHPQKEKNTPGCSQIPFEIKGEHCTTHTSPDSSIFSRDPSG